MRIEQLRSEFDLNIRWSVFPLHPETPDKGVRLDDLFAGKLDIAAMQERLREVATGLGLPIGPREYTYNSRLAQELGKWAEGKGEGEAFHRAVYQAYFAEGRNIADPIELIGLAGELGLDPETARSVLVKRSYAPAVDADWRRASEFGVTAVPTTIHAGRKLVGFQPYDQFRELITGDYPDPR